MSESLGARGWFPLIATATVLFVLVFAVDAVASKTVADLVGLCYLIAAPFLYRGLQALVGDRRGRSTERPGSSIELPTE